MKIAETLAVADFHVDIIVIVLLAKKEIELGFYLRYLLPQSQLLGRFAKMLELSFLCLDLFSL